MISFKDDDRFAGSREADDYRGAGAEVHDETHDPILDHATCEICNAALRRAFNDLAGMQLGPKDADTLIERIREGARA